jgi:hypothetical protein
MTSRSQFPDLNGPTALPAMRPEKTSMKHPLGKTPMKHPLEKPGPKKDMPMKGMPPKKGC